MHCSRIFLIPLLLAVTPRAQEPKFGTRSFFPANYNGEVKVEVGRLTELGVTGELMRSPLAAAAAMFRREFGFSVEDLERVTFAIHEGVEGEGDEAQDGSRAVWVLEGEPSVCVGESSDGDVEATLGGVKLVEREGMEMCSPRAGLLVIESKFRDSQHLLSSVLEGKRKAGVPEPALLELTTRPHLLAHVSRLVPAKEARQLRLFPGIDPSWGVEEDPMSAISLRVFEEPKTESFRAELLLRFQTGQAGPQLFEGKLKGLLTQAATLKPFQPLKSLVQRVETRIDGRDLVASIDFGSGRAAIAEMGKLGMLIAMWGADAPAEIEVAAQVPQVIPPAPLPEKKDGDGR